MKFNHFHDVKNKGSIFRGGAVRTDNDAITYGVRMQGNQFEGSTFPFEIWDVVGNHTTRHTGDNESAPAVFVNDQSGPAGAGNGDYHPGGGSELIGRVTGVAWVSERVLTYDLEGSVFGDGSPAAGNAGAFAT